MSCEVFGIGITNCPDRMIGPVAPLNPGGIYEEPTNHRPVHPPPIHLTKLDFPHLQIASSPLSFSCSRLIPRIYLFPRRIEQREAHHSVIIVVVCSFGEFYCCPESGERRQKRFVGQSISYGGWGTLLGTYLALLRTMSSG